MSGRPSKQRRRQRDGSRTLRFLDRRRPYYPNKQAFVYDYRDCSRCTILYGIHRKYTRHRIPTTTGNMQCLQCGTLTQYPGITNDYYWKELSVVCKACGVRIEQNNKEAVGFCWTKNCPAERMDASGDYRCSQCGSSGLRYIGSTGGRGLHYRCADCDANMSILQRSAC